MNMTPEQFTQLLSAIADRPYTLTGAADWPLLVVLGIGYAGLVGVMWHDLKQAFRDGRTEAQICLEQYRKDHAKEHERIELAMRECQEECCPPRIRS